MARVFARELILHREGETWVSFLGVVDVDEEVAARLIAVGATPVDDDTPLSELPAPGRKRAPAPKKKAPQPEG